MKKPADAARAPLGATEVITGTSEAMMRWLISRIESIRPPGVSIRSTKLVRVPGRLGLLYGVRHISTVTGAITPLISAIRMWGREGGAALPPAR